MVRSKNISVTIPWQVRGVGGLEKQCKIIYVLVVTIPWQVRGVGGLLIAPEGRLRVGCGWFVKVRSSGDSGARKVCATLGMGGCLAPLTVGCDAFGAVVRVSLFHCDGHA